jgi:hypothetical protein
MKKIVSIIMAIMILAVVATGCAEEGDNAQNKSYEEVTKKAESRKPYLPKNDVEFNNYNKAQQLYDSPTTIIWCSVMPQASTAPILTVPVTGKLTSSSTSYFSPTNTNWSSEGSAAVTSARSVDGLYHPDPPKYRYGFTPGGEYVDFYELPTFCTTKPLNFQKDSVQVKVDETLTRATKEAEKALASGNNAKAEKILQTAAGE